MIFGLRYYNVTKICMAGNTYKSDVHLQNNMSNYDCRLISSATMKCIFQENEVSSSVEEYYSRLSITEEYYCKQLNSLTIF